MENREHGDTAPEKNSVVVLLGVPSGINTDQSGAMKMYSFLENDFE
jgi:hypothetical protein